MTEQKEFGLPFYGSGLVVKGFGRGSKHLGIPTANLHKDVIDKMPEEMTTGVYYGWAQVQNFPVHKMVMSVGWNPFYKNEEKSMEIHILHEFKEDFYGSNLRIIVVGYVRPEMDFDSVDDLIKTIHSDIDIAKKQLDQKSCRTFSKDHFFDKHS
ncbi:riboflavin kinase [Adelges cooleyi]|uniref:riboflavin kinase n=1 Tax=Adelges cooleyi TaxID=133065 RepID=UPI0021805268|nr:riboflavin kinase [Adelges cooleyi]